MGLSTDHLLFVDISHVSVEILVGDLSPMRAPLLMCSIAKKVLHRFLNSQGSSYDNEIDHANLTFLVSIAIFMQTTKGKNAKERLQQKNVSSKNEPFF